MGLHAIVLDFDGVIVNSEPLHLRATQWVLADEGIALSARQYYADMVGLTDAEMFERLAAERGLEAPAAWSEALTARKALRMQQMLDDEAPLFPSAAERIRTLASRFPLAVVSGAMRPEIEHVLRSASIADCFVTVVAAGDTPRGKPAPDPYLLALRRLSAHVGVPLEPSSVVAIEDTVQGLSAVRAAGLRAVAVTTTCPADALGTADLVLPDIAAVTVERLEALFDSPPRQERDGPV